MRKANLWVLGGVGLAVYTMAAHLTVLFFPPTFIAVTGVWPVPLSYLAAAVYFIVSYVKHQKAGNEQPSAWTVSVAVPVAFVLALLTVASMVTYNKYAVALNGVTLEPALRVTELANVTALGRDFDVSVRTAEEYVEGQVRTRGGQCGFAVSEVLAGEWSMPKELTVRVPDESDKRWGTIESSGFAPGVNPLKSRRGSIEATVRLPEGDTEEPILLKGRIEDIPISRPESTGARTYKVIEDLDESEEFQFWVLPSAMFARVESLRQRLPDVGLAYMGGGVWLLCAFVMLLPAADALDEAEKGTKSVPGTSEKASSTDD